MKHFIIAIFLMGFSSIGFSMTEENIYERYLYLHEDYNELKNELLINDKIILSIRSSRGIIYPKEIKVSAGILGLNAKKLIENRSKLNSENRFNIQIEENNYPYFYVLINLIHGIKQDENIKCWKLHDLKKFIELAKDLGCFEAIEGMEGLHVIDESIYRLIKLCMQNLSLIEIENLIAELPSINIYLEKIEKILAEVKITNPGLIKIPNRQLSHKSLEEAVFKGLRKFSRENYPSYSAHLAAGIGKFSALLAFTILENPDFYVDHEDKFATLVLEWMREKNPNDKIAVVPDEHKRLLSLIRCPFLSYDFKSIMLSQFSGRYSLDTYVGKIYEFALVCGLAGGNENYLKILCNSRSMPELMLQARKSYGQVIQK